MKVKTDFTVPEDLIHAPLKFLQTESASLRVILDIDHIWQDNTQQFDFESENVLEKLEDLHSLSKEAFWTVTTEHARSKVWGMITCTEPDYVDCQSNYGNISKGSQGGYLATTPLKNNTITDIFDKLNHRSGQPYAWKEKQEKDIATLYNVTIAQEDTTPKQANATKQVSTTSKHLNRVKQVFSLTDEELSASLGTTRKTLHNWQKQSTKPNKVKLERLLLQSSIAEEWLANGYPLTASMDPSDKKALLDLLTADAAHKDKILFFGSGLMLTSVSQDIEDPFS